ncbi:MAG TPA: CHRD domain-containing protein [Gammaproteobacteria bacterium]|nr:CHRD domain-containing protein [Gammaproteobacteria bacterium]
MGTLIRAAAVGFALLAAVPGLAKDDAWRARLARVPIDAATAAAVTGSGQASAVLHGRKLEIMGSFEGLHGAATTAELRAGPVTGVRGGAVAPIEVTQDVAGSLSASIDLSDEQIAALRAGRLYIQIDSKSAPDGNLWGWLLP